MAFVPGAAQLGVMHRMTNLAAILSIAILLAGCGEPYRAEAALYVDATHEALIEKSICLSQTECRSKQIVFWGDGEYAGDVFPKDVTFVNLYGIEDPEIVGAVVAKLSQIQMRISRPGVVLNVYKSKYLEKPVKLQRIVIK